MFAAKTRLDGEYLRYRLKARISATVRRIFRLNLGSKKHPISGSWSFADDGSVWASSYYGPGPLEVPSVVPMEVSPTPPKGQSTSRDKQLQSFSDGCWDGWKPTSEDGLSYYGPGPLEVPSVVPMEVSPTPPKGQSTSRDKQLQSFIDGCWDGWKPTSENGLQVCSECWVCFASSLVTEIAPVEKMYSQTEWDNLGVFYDVMQSTASSHWCDKGGRESRNSWLRFTVQLKMKSKHGRLELVHLTREDASWKRSRFEVQENEATTGDDTTMASIRASLLVCLTKHAACVGNEWRTPRLPTRVIDISGNGDPFLSDSNGRCGIYMTLSHRWAGSSITKTTTTNLESMRSAIPWDSLTKVMQDAITIARSLCIQYLWIDSLCIIQDSPEDWASEAIEMATIYHSSLLNIAADCAHDHEDGIFRNRKQRSMEIYGSATPLNFTIPSPIGASPSALDSRGWVLQEQLLAPRTVKFLDDSVEWICPSHSNSSAFVQAAHGIHTSGSKSLTRQAYGSWHGVVESYSRRILTNKADKLMAIAGVAHYMGLRLKQRCLAGLWMGNLVGDLLWTAYDRPGRIEGYTIPTWSWACIDGPVTYSWSRWANSYYHHRKLDILEVYVDENTTPGGVQGTVVIDGRLVSATLDDEGYLILLHQRDNIFLRDHERGGRQRWYPDMPLDCLKRRYPDCGSLSAPIKLLEVAVAYHYYHYLCLAVVDVVANRFERVGICRVDTSRVDVTLAGGKKRLTIV